MQLKKSAFASFIIVAIMLVVWLTGCGQQKEKPETAGIVITDAAGKTISLSRPLQRVVILTPSIAEAMRLLKVPDEAIVGVSDNVQNMPFLGLKNKPLVGKWTQPNVEKIAELKPEAVLTYGKYPSKEVRDKIEALGIKVIGVDFYYLDKYDEDFLRVAKVFGKEARAQQFLQWKNQHLATIEKRLAGSKNKPGILCLWTTYFTKGTWKTFAPGSSYDQAINLAGGINLASELPASPETPEVSGEWVLSKNPEALVMVYTSDGLGYNIQDLNKVKELEKEVKKNPVLSKTKAVENKKVYFLNISGLGRFVEVIYLAKWLHPEHFQDVNPEQILKEYFEKWLEVPFKGKWAYPEP
ncbi:iron complex transport system substrate-binding protein [Thermanaeromonas toyohensis ToBE]|uniref:Iron complex transport system substrate-binding protein n=1 Tax=Thermanaeromonas toyohensis ToBE TaxID=698762 RepID=A0A1W1VCW8_9FIRM|nr:ABC transporter substrate-binding protein [Thermanaeromonas toyohensis]SMB91222.1 iron complex transport system substrate-binding protein [Thermanaeromonas toyohensis ToBE]